LDYWTEWGDKAYPGETFANVQNQTDVADWPCYSKLFIAMPLDTLPKGQNVISATLTLHLFGNAGGGDWGNAPDSLLQVFEVDGGWNEATLSWNSAPLALENISRTWVEPIISFPGWPGVPYTWDVSIAVARSYAAGIPLRLAVYSADPGYHSGKYFITSEAEDWNKLGRPTLKVWLSP
jgi:hypothetical protein